MKSTLVIASVLLVGVALGVNAYRIDNNNNNNNNNQDENQNQWFRFQQTDSSDESFNVGAILFDQKTDDSKIYNNNDQFNKHIMNNNDNFESTFASRKYQNNQYDETHFGLTENLNQKQRQQQQYENQNQGTSGQSTDETHFGLNENLNQKQRQQQQPRQYGSQNQGTSGQSSDETHFGLNENLNQKQRQQLQQQQQQQQQYGSQNQGTSGQSNGLAKKIADKIAAIQQIAVNDNIADNINYLNGELAVARNSIKLSDNKFVSLYNSTMKNMDNGKLKYMYLNPEKDTVFALYHFNQIETVGSYNSDVRDARSGYYTIVMNNVYSNLSTGFYDDKHSVVRPARFQNADANVKTQDGSETRAFNSALQRFLGVLSHAVSNEVKMSARSNALVQIKNEIIKPIVLQSTEDKLFEFMWQEGNVAIEMSNIEFQNSQLASATEQLLKSMTFQRKSQDSYTTVYDFVLNKFGWTSTMNVVSAGKTTNTPRTKFDVEKINIRVYLTRWSFDQQQSCDNISTSVNVQGLNYNLDNNLRPEVVSAIDNNLERCIQHSLESNIQTALKQIVCNNNYNKY